MYEMDEPYCYYQYLIVNGVAMDGHNDTPRIFRYTGGKATPEVQWKYAFVEADYPYSIVEYKYIRGNDGKMVLIYHKLSENPLEWGDYCIPPHMFESDIEYLKTC